jgi:glycosyltransferase involved in cell wall biosynthesis
VSVVVPTRGRPTHAEACVARILACRGAFEVIVVDQSEGAETKRSLGRHLADRRLRYVRSLTRGVAAARNVGIAVSRGELVAFTDDDCRVPPEWIERFEQVFRQDPETGIVCGRVALPPGSDSLGYAAAFEPRRRVYKGQMPPPGADWGITANMIVRRRTLGRIGVFDELLGAGAPLRSGAETDLLVRAWRAGLQVVNASEVEVLHLGVRRYGRDARVLLIGYLIGTGAVFAKHARLGGAQERRLYARWLDHLIRGGARNLLRRKRPTGIALALAFLWGSILSCRYRIARDPALYVRPG